MDGTFKVVRKPFYQLFTINVYINEAEVQQVPALFVLMSSRTTEDYERVRQMTFLCDCGAII